MTEAILALVVAVIGLIGAVARTYVKTNLTPRRMATIVDFARNAVTAAEKLGVTLDDFTGPAKYEYAEKAVDAFARRLGVRLSPEETNTIVHAVLVELDGLESLFVNGFPMPEDEDDDYEDAA